ncbi:TonB-dependent receptor domain-containing protein [Desulfosarcina ovata]|nr:TonB-dependent receptor [Desulfosarcina ovata]
MPQTTAADESNAGWVSKMVSLQGRVRVRRKGETVWQPVLLDDTFFVGDQIYVEANSRAGIRLVNDALLRLDQQTMLIMTEIEQPSTFFIRLIKGAVHFFSHRPRSLKIITPFVNAIIEGTEFFVRVDPDQTRIDLFEGRILAENPYGSLQLVPGQGAVALAGRAPQFQVLVRPRDSVQWALYYPPIPALSPDERSTDINAALSLANQGRIPEALTRLEDLEPQARSARFFVLRAALLLCVGRVVEAGSDIRRALEVDPASGNALALQSVIAIVQNRNADALRLAREAVRLAPRSAAAQIALSYALQADLDLPGALEAARNATAQVPGDGVAWARLAELRICVGELDKGVEAAQKAADLSPHTAHAHTILGFAYLTQIKTGKARDAFNHAITLDSAAPLPRLGLGLATIRDGDLEEGRAQIEIAAGLDPNNALIRSYLGKAYFDEKRGPLDERQLEIAKSLDPNDPTPWLYDAIRLQSANRPVEALQSLQKSIELNDNRAIYRSRLLLDEDRAARGVSLARIYDDLGFEQRSLVESTKSLSIDPTNYSAHRFLSDTYMRLPQHQIAQVSELLQAQLLQPVNINPVQPRLSIKGISTVSGVGPGEAAFNEYTPLFERNKPQLTVAGIVGNNDTYGDEAVLSGIEGPFSYSLGQFHYQNDGFRENSNVEHDIYNAFTQVAITNKMNMQFEYRRRETSQGDLRLFLYPATIPPHSRNLEHDIWRAGLHLSLSSRNDVIASFFYSDRREWYLSEVSDQRVENNDGREGYDTEVQYLFHEDTFNVLIGGGAYRVDAEYEYTMTTEEIPLPFPFPPIPATSTSEKGNYAINGDTLYIYANIKVPESIVWTLGLSYETYEDTDMRFNLERVNPKLGLQWDLTERFRFRAAYIRNIKRMLAVDQTIEPTQVAGFNQFFDDINGTWSKLSGIAIDAKLTNGLYTGFEFIQRDLSEASERDEKTYRGYLNWALFSNWSINAEYQFERDLLSFELETTSVPLEIRYFSPIGFFGQIGPTFVWQEMGTGTEPQEKVKDDFVVVDAAIGYRLPNRLGMISFEICNLLNEEFRFQDASFKTSDKFNVIQPFLPERTFFVRVVLNY